MPVHKHLLIVDGRLVHDHAVMDMGLLVAMVATVASLAFKFHEGNGSHPKYLSIHLLGWTWKKDGLEGLFLIWFIRVMKHHTPSDPNIPLLTYLPSRFMIDEPTLDGTMGRHVMDGLRSACACACACCGKSTHSLIVKSTFYRCGHNDLLFCRGKWYYYGLVDRGSAEVVVVVVDQIKQKMLLSAYLGTSTFPTYYLTYYQRLFTTSVYHLGTYSPAGNWEFIPNRSCAQVHVSLFRSEEMDCTSSSSFFFPNGKGMPIPKSIPHPVSS